LSWELFRKIITVKYHFFKTICIENIRLGSKLILDAHEIGTKRQKKSKNNKWMKLVALITLILLIITISYGGFVFFKAKDALNQSQINLNRKGGKSELRVERGTFGKEPISILLLGVENYSTDGKDGRADTQIIITLNPKMNEMYMMTIPRDTRVTIENAGKYTGVHKINAAYTYGSITGYGAVKLQVETVEKLLNIPIDKVVAVDFDGFRDIVDAFGGVDIDIKEGFWEHNIYKNEKKIYFESGKSHLNGEESLAFVRMRYRDVNKSYPREERQRQFLQAMINQATSTETIFKVGQITDILGKNVKTDLTATQIYALQKQYSTITSSSINTLNIDGTGLDTKEGWYYIPNKESLEKVSQKLRDSLEIDQVSNFTTNADIVVP